MRALWDGPRPEERPGERPSASERARWLVGPGALATTAALLATAALLLNLSIISVGQSRSLAFETGAVLQQIANVRADLRTAETGQRGYLLTGERRYLAPYEQAVARVWARFDELIRGVRTPAQQERLGALRPLIEAKLQELAETVELRTQGLENALAVVRTDRGQRLMEEIDGLADAFEKAEQATFAERTGALERSAELTTWLAGLTGLLALGSAVLGVLWLARQRAEAKRIEVERRFRRDLERQVERRTAELTDLNRELDAFAYTISHDLRAPLRAMHGYADALAEDFAPALPKDGRHFIDRIGAAAGRMESLIQDILAYSRLAREEVTLRPTSLERVVDDVLARAGDAVAAAGARIEVERPLPEAMAHPPILGQAIENLVLNAVKFVAPGVVPRLRIRAERGDGTVRLLVEDNGIGIAPEHHERIFRPFERLHGADAYPGTGIGLGIVRRSLERMGGRCGVTSSAASGSTFWIELAAGAEGRGP